MFLHLSLFSFFFFNDTATTEIYTLSLHDALPISRGSAPAAARSTRAPGPSWHGLGSARDADPHSRRARRLRRGMSAPDRKSTRLNFSHSQISYAVFCLKKKKINYEH